MTHNLIDSKHQYITQTHTKNTTNKNRIYKESKEIKKSYFLKIQNDQRVMLIFTTLFILLKATQPN